MSSFKSFKKRAEGIMSDVYALYLARGDPRIPWYAKAIIVLTVIYALSPVDLIPDFIPFVGYLDDLIIIPAGIALAVRLMPANVWEEYRGRAQEGFAGIRLNSWEGLLILLFIMLEVWWILALGLVLFILGGLLAILLFPSQGLLNIGSVLGITGLFILAITGVIFRRRLQTWRTTAQSLQKKDPGLP
ncbi:MAG TPA: YkvA family protein [Methanoregula sp.]|nr:YkvA family protein [Methanoregula sp.]